MASIANHISAEILTRTTANDRVVALAQNGLSLEGIDLIIGGLTLLSSVLVLSLILG